MKNLMLLIAFAGSLMLSSCWVWYDDYYDRPPRHERPMRSGHYDRPAPAPYHHYRGR
jgi:hypothetical protein